MIVLGNRYYEKFDLFSTFSTLLVEIATQMLKTYTAALNMNSVFFFQI